MQFWTDAPPRRFEEVHFQLKAKTPPVIRLITGGVLLGQCCSLLDVGENYFSDDMSITNRYFTSLLSIRS